MSTYNVGVLALQGAFMEHLQLLRRSAHYLSTDPKYSTTKWSFSEIRTAEQLARCDALIIPGGESTTMSHVAARSGLLEPLRDFVKTSRKPVWGTCAGMILLAESANRTETGGQELIGGLDVRVNRNHFGRQTESFEADLDLQFVDGGPFKSLFIRAPIVEKVLPSLSGVQTDVPVGTVVAPTRGQAASGQVEIMARLPGSAKILESVGEQGEIVAVKQGNVFGTSFHPELTGDDRIHVWWLKQVVDHDNKK